MDELKQSIKSSFGWIEIANYTADPVDTNSGRAGLAVVNNVLRRWTGSAWTNADTGGTAGATGGLNAVYSLSDNSVTLDEGAITLTSAAAGNMLVFVKGDTGAGNLIDVTLSAAFAGNVIDLTMDSGIAAGAIYIDDGASARTGAEFYVKDDSTGNHTIVDIVKTGSGATTGFSYDEQYNGSTTSFAISINLTANDAIDTTAMIVARGAGARSVPVIDIDDASTASADLIDIDLTGVLTGDVFAFATSAAATGNVLNLDVSNAAAMSAITIAGDGARSQPFIELIGTQTGSADMIDLSADGIFTGNVIGIDMNAAVGGKAIFIDAGSATRTAALMLVTFDGDGTTTGGTFLDLNVTNTGGAASPLIDIDITGLYTGNIIDIAFGTAASTGDAIVIDMDTNLAGSALVLDAGNKTRTGDMCQVTFDGAGQLPFWDINITNTGAGGTSDYWDIDVTGVLTGSVLDIVYGAAATGDAIVVNMGTAVGAAALSLISTGARSDALVKITDDSTGVGSRSLIDIGITGAGTFPVLDINIGNSAINATAILLTEGTGTSTVPLVDINSAGTGATATIDIDYTGVFTGNGLDITYGSAAATGNAIDLNMGTNVAGMAISIASAATGVSGEGAAIDIVHTGNLVASADLMRIVSSGTHNAACNLLYVEGTGASNSGTYAVRIKASGTNIEALKVEAGDVTFDENLTVTKTLTQTGIATFAAGFQATTVARTAGDGTGTAAIAAGTTFVLVTSDSADKWVALPTPVVGNIIYLTETSAVGYELRCADPANQYLNNVTGANVELAVAADTTIMCVCNENGATGGWICMKWDNVGAPASGGTAGA